MKIRVVEASIRELVRKNDGYCPCAVQKTPDTKCMCKEFREKDTPGLCHCGLYEKVEEPEEPEIPEEALYVMYHDDEAVAYRYGAPWVAMELMMEGGFDTEEEAREHWARYKEEDTDED